ncbi:glycosyltransferase family 2 protein [Mariprofundus ferrooxydans]|uniref:glycosyltransferase family 2 protein n=1 Tax=Mariprofundus ferrooxydans TaxID=314344 RepID=UPI000377F8EA|nr:glycosyltransferase family 2 protein [Mariprofundus ferrooxydans]
MTELSIIIVSYNTKELTLACLKSVFEETEGVDFEVIVLDNNSSDFSAEAIASEYPQVQLIANKENLGFAGGNNLAAMDASGEFLLLLNPDTIILNAAIQNLLSFAKDNIHAKIWGGRTLFGDKSLNPSSCWRETYLWEIFCRSFMLSSLFPNSHVFNTGSYGGWDRSAVRQVDIVSGCFFMLKRDLWEKLGGFSPEFFMYGEEADLCLRAAKLYGAKPMVTPDATIIHYGGASEKLRADKMVRLLNAKRLLIKKHWPVWKYKLGMLIYPLYPMNRALVFRVLGLIKKKYNAESSDWLDVWHRRKEWMG